MNSTELYNKHKYGVIGQLLNRGASIRDVDDIYHETIIAIINNVKRGKIKYGEFNGSYVWGVAKNILLNRFSKVEIHNRIVAKVCKADKPYFSNEELDNAREILCTYLNELSGIRGQVLYKYFLEDKSHETIAEELELASTESSKSQKWKGLKQLREKMNKNFKKEDLC